MLARRSGPHILTSSLPHVLLFLAPSLILFTVRLHAIASVWLALWLLYLLFVIRHFPRVQTARKARQD